MVLGREHAWIIDGVDLMGKECKKCTCATYCFKAPKIASRATEEQSTMVDKGIPEYKALVAQIFEAKIKEELG